MQKIAATTAAWFHCIGGLTGMWKLSNILLALVLGAGLAFVYVLLSIRGLEIQNWFFVVLSIVFFSIFFLFLPYRKRMSRRPASVYLAFIVSLYVEMY